MPLFGVPIQAPNAPYIIENCPVRFKMHGLVLVGESDSVFIDPTFGSEAFRWTQAGGMVGLGDLPGGTFGSKAFFVSADGSVVWPMGQLMQTETASVLWSGRVKGCTMRSRCFKLDREPPC